MVSGSERGKAANSHQAANPRKIKEIPTKSYEHPRTSYEILGKS